MKKTILLTMIFTTIISIVAFAQTDKALSNNKESGANEDKPTMVINEKMLAQYQDYVENGTYTSMWETIKDYNFTEMKDFYAEYRSHNFTETTTYADIELAVKENEEAKDKMAEAGHKPKKVVELTASNEK